MKKKTKKRTKLTSIPKEHHREKPIKKKTRNTLEKVSLKKIIKKKEHFEVQLRNLPIYPQPKSKLDPTKDKRNVSITFLFKK